MFEFGCAEDDEVAGDDEVGNAAPALAQVVGQITQRVPDRLRRSV